MTDLTGGRALTLWQPWASLVAHGHKQYETRSWGTDYRGVIYIHASKKWDATLARGSREIRSMLAGLGLSPFPEDLPLGKIIARGYLTDCVPTRLVRRDVSELEKRIGDFGPDRFAWKIENVFRFPEPVPCVGHQGLWTFKPGEVPVQ